MFRAISGGQIRRSREISRDGMHPTVVTMHSCRSKSHVDGVAERASGDHRSCGQSARRTSDGAPAISTRTPRTRRRQSLSPSRSRRPAEAVAPRAGRVLNIHVHRQPLHPVEPLPRNITRHEGTASFHTRDLRHYQAGGSQRTDSTSIVAGKGVELLGAPAHGPPT